MRCFLFLWAFSIFTLVQGDNKPAFLPTQYTLNIITDEDHFKDTTTKPFEGTVKIELEKNKIPPTDEKILVELNIDPKMVIKSAKLNVAKTIPRKAIEGKKETDKLVFELSKSDYESGTGFTIHVSYSNNFGEDMTGFYRSSYKVDGKNRWLLTTHFEPIYARKAFPCFDKPNLKAEYKISINVPKSLEGYHVLSNTPCAKKSGTLDDKFNVFECKETNPAISSYLVAFTVSDFVSTEELKFESSYGSYPKERSLKTYGQKNLIKSGTLSQTAAKEAITNLAKYLNLGYAYEKIDQVGIPDFTAGAMENWGLISYRENKLFFTESDVPSITKQGNVLTITHELAHQWFGNLVTPETWDNIWLNEAFATYLQYLIGSQTKNPDTSKWDLLNQLVVNEIHLRAFETDGIATSKHLSHKVEKEDLIFSYFNDISYSKGAAVLRMWDLSSKAGKFQKSLQGYLTENKGGSVTPDVLYNAFKKEMQMDEKFFKSWVENAGYPVVEVKNVDKNYVLTQSRFLWENSKAKSPIWTLPITYTTDDQKSGWATELKVLMDKESLTLEKVGGKWIIINNQQAGYYRVNYEKKNWEALSAALKNNLTQIHEINRAQIINDVFSLARSLQKNYVEYFTALDLAEYLKKEDSLIPWKSALNALEFLQTKLYKDDKLYQYFKSYILKLLNEKYKGLEVQKLSHAETLMAVEISRWACSLNHEPCVQKALALYKKSDPLPSNTQEIILCTAVRHLKDGAKEVLEKYTKTEDASQKIVYLSALGCSNSETFLNEYLSLTLKDKSSVRKQDFFYVLSSVYKGNLNNVKVAFEFVNKHYEEIEKSYGGINPLGRALVDMAKKLNSEADLKKMEDLAKKFNDLGPVKDSVQTAVSIVKSNIEWAKVKKPQISLYFSAGSLASYSYVLLSVCLAFIFRS